MKKPLLYVLILTGIWCVSSCRKEYSLENQGAVMANFVAQIDGVHWQSAVSTEQATLAQGLINITGISADNQEISMTLSGTGTGTYTLSQQSASLATYANIDSSFVYAYTTNQSSNPAAAAGQVTITEIDETNKTISGTFTFNAYRAIDGGQKTITQGVFTKIPFTSSLPSANTADTMTATIDNKAWIGSSVMASVNIAGGELTIVGTSADSTQAIGLLMPANVTPGNYPLDGTNLSYFGVYTMLVNSNSSGLVSVAGTLTVLQNDTTNKRVRGTFNFTASNPLSPGATHIIASGVFSVYYGP